MHQETERCKALPYISVTEEDNNRSVEESHKEYHDWRIRENFGVSMEANLLDKIDHDSSQDHVHQDNADWDWLVSEQSERCLAKVLADRQLGFPILLATVSAELRLASAEALQVIWILFYFPVLLPVIIQLPILDCKIFELRLVRFEHFTASSFLNWWVLRSCLQLPPRAIKLNDKWSVESQKKYYENRPFSTFPSATPACALNRSILPNNITRILCLHETYFPFLFIIREEVSAGIN